MNKILIIGHARHGKDTAALILQRLVGLRVTSSSQAACSTCVFPVLRERYSYQTEQQCWEDRTNHRKEWFDLICAYNESDPSRLTKDILESYDVYIGLRARAEFEASRHLFNHVVWVDRSDILPPESTTSMQLSIKDATSVIDNNGSLQDLTNNIRKWRNTHL